MSFWLGIAIGVVGCAAFQAVIAVWWHKMQEGDRRRQEEWAEDHPLINEDLARQAEQN